MSLQKTKTLVYHLFLMIRYTMHSILSTIKSMDNMMLNNTWNSYTEKYWSKWVGELYLNKPTCSIQTKRYESIGCWEYGKSIENTANPKRSQPQQSTLLGVYFFSNISQPKRRKWCDLNIFELACLCKKCFPIVYHI